MAQHPAEDAWQAGNSYDRYMGRWSRKLAPVFLDWLAPPPGLDWIDVGCGTGALTAAICTRAAPQNVVGIDPAEGFLRVAAERNADPRATFKRGDADNLPVDTASQDIAVSGLVLNFVPDPHLALKEMRRAVKAGGTVAYYVWDYPGQGIEFVSSFWRAAIALDPAAAEIEQGKRFAFCTRDGVLAKATEAKLDEPSVTALEIETVFSSFDDYWEPFTLGTGPAPGYCSKLSEAQRSALRDKLRDIVPIAADGTLALRARAWAVRARNGH